MREIIEVVEYLPHQLGWKRRKDLDSDLGAQVWEKEGELYIFAPNTLGVVTMMRRISDWKPLHATTH